MKIWSKTVFTIPRSKDLQATIHKSIWIFFHVTESIDPENLPEVDKEDELVGLAFVDQNDKAAYGFVDYKGEEVEFDIKSFGDRSGVVYYTKNLPSGGYTEDVETVSGNPWQNAAVEPDEHP